MFPYSFDFNYGIPVAAPAWYSELGRETLERDIHIHGSQSFLHGFNPI